MGLIGVADGADVAVRTNELLQEPDLQCVDILVLVDRDPPMVPPVVRPQRRVGFERVHRAHDEIVEIAQVASLHRALVCLEHLARSLVRRRPVGTLCARDRRQPTPRLPLGDVQRIAQQLNPLGLRRDPKAALQARRVVVRDQDGHAKGVERMQRHPFPRIGQERLQTVAHLAGGPARESDCENTGPGRPHGS